MSTGLIIAIVAVVVVAVALVAFVASRTGDRRRQRELNRRRQVAAERHRRQAETRTERAQIAEQRARIAEQEAERERAAAGLEHERAVAHERGMADDELERIDRSGDGEGVTEHGPVDDRASRYTS